MVSPGTLRALRELASGDDDAFEPSIDETGTVTYPDVEQHIAESDGEPVEVLETMTDRGVLASEFEYKAYVCPHCSLEGMQFSTACPDCESVHATEETTAVHSACGSRLDARGSDTVDSDQTAESEQSDPDVRCPDCEEEVTAEDRETVQRYRCHDCSSWFETPDHRLWCRECRRVYPPADVREEPVYRYPLTGSGEEWVTEQVERRELLAETFDARGYETETDTTVSTDGEKRRVHVYADDELLDDRIVAGVHDTASEDDVRRLVEAARSVDARPVLLSTSGSVDEPVAELIDRENVTVVSASDGMLSREYDVTEQTHEESTLVSDLLESVFSPSRR